MRLICYAGVNSPENRKQDPASYDPGEVQRILDPGNDGACQQ